MRNMSFALTTAQIIGQTKDVTRRDGWAFLKPGDRICAVKKVMGLRRGERLDRLAVLRVVDVRCEPLRTLLREASYGWRDVAREGFPSWTPTTFAEFFVSTHKGVTVDTPLTRIEFVHENPWIVFPASPVIHMAWWGDEPRDKMAFTLCQLGPYEPGYARLRHAGDRYCRRCEAQLDGRSVEERRYFKEVAGWA